MLNVCENVDLYKAIERFINYQIQMIGHGKIYSTFIFAQKYALKFKSEKCTVTQIYDCKESILVALGISIIHVDDFFIAINIFCLVVQDSIQHSQYLDL